MTPTFSLTPTGAQADTDTLDLDDVLSRLEGVKRSGNGWQALCPAHNDRTPSLHISKGDSTNVVLYCHAGCSFESIISAIDLLPQKQHNGYKNNGYPKIVAEYDYRDEQGILLYQRLREQPKSFPQRQPDGKGGWIKNLHGVRRVLYGLPELLKSDGLVLYVEGEKDVQAARRLGYTATTAGSAGDWRNEFAQYFTERELVIIPDNDGVGRELAQRIAKDSTDAGAKVRIVELPNVLEKGDLSDWVKLGGTGERLLELIDAACYFDVTADTTNAPTLDAPIEIISEPAPIPAIEFNDSGNADRFIAQHGKDVRYCPNFNQWLIWDGKRWRKDDSNAIYVKAKETARSYYADAANEVDSKKRNDLAVWAKTSGNLTKLKDMIESAACVPSVIIRQDALDSDPFLLNVANGTIDLKTGRLLPHRREDFITKIIPIEYDPSATMPTIERFLYQIFNGDANLINFVQRYLGYSLTGVTSEQCYAILYGTGANGKSTFLELLELLLGDYALHLAAETLLAKGRPSGDSPRSDLTALAGARFVAAIETEDGARIAEALIKQLTGGDKLTARTAYAKYAITFKPQFKLWLATNHKPEIRGTDLATWRRIRLVPFSVTFPEEQQDKHLIEKLRSELSGLLTWAVKGCLEWQRFELQTPDAVKQATQSYRNEMDGIQRFLDERCVIQQGVRVKSSDLHSEYEKWSKLNGEAAVSQRAFSLKLIEKGYERTDPPTRYGVFWLGIGLKVD